MAIKNKKTINYGKKDGLIADGYVHT